MEMDPRQIDAVAALAAERLPVERSRVVNDLAGRQRGLGVGEDLGLLGGCAHAVTPAGCWTSCFSVANASRNRLGLDIKGGQSTIMGPLL